MVVPGTVLICKINPRINRAWVVGNYSHFRKIASTEWVAIPPVDGIEPRYLAQFLRQKYVRDFLAHNVSGVGGSLMRVRPNVVDEIDISIPPTLEQVQIADKLDELLSDLDAGTAALERARANLKRYRAAILTSAVQGRLSEPWRRQNPDIEPASRLLERILAERRKRWEDAQRAKYAERGQTPPKGWQDRYPEPVAPDVSDLPALPEGWYWASIDQLAEVQGGIQKQPKRAPKENSYPYLRVGNVLRGRLDLSRMERFELFDGELERLRLKVNDLLIVEGNGSRSEIGRCALWRGEIKDCVHQNHIIRLRPSQVLAEYLLTYWNSTPGSQRIMDRAASTSGLYTLSVQKVSELPVPLPSLLEQTEIVALVDQQLSVLDRNAQAIEAQLARAVRLRQAILKRAFEGRLVPQDPNDEPASKLLERIRAERAAAEVSAPPRRRVRRKAD